MNKPRPDPITTWADLSADAALASAAQASRRRWTGRPRRAAGAPRLGVLAIAAVVIGAMVALRPSSGPSTNQTAVIPASPAQSPGPSLGGSSPTAPLLPSQTPSSVIPPGQPLQAAVTCKVGRESCDAALEVVRRAHPTEVEEAIQIVIADTCPPPSLCDRVFAFDSAVVVVPPPPDSAALAVYHVVGSPRPLFIISDSGPLPDHIRALVPDPGRATTDDGTFRLSLATERKVYRSTDTIAPMATLAAVGPDTKVVFGHSDPAAFFTIEEVGGLGRQMTGGASDSCSITTLAGDHASAVPFQKAGAGGFGFDEAWFRDPVLRLPPGTWRLSVRFEGSIPACEIGATPHALVTENVIRVR